MNRGNVGGRLPIAWAWISLSCRTLCMLVEQVYKQNLQFRMFIFVCVFLGLRPVG